MTAKRKVIVWYEQDGWPYLGYSDTRRRGLRVDDLTLEQLANFCDCEADRTGVPDYMGAHRLLAAMLHRRIGRKYATRILYDIATMGGLHVMNGSTAGEPAFEVLGITPFPEDWKLT